MFTPTAMVFARTADDVILALTITASYNVTLAVRSGAGHSYIAQSTCDGIVLSLRNMTLVTPVVEADGSVTAACGGGIKMLDVSASGNACQCMLLLFVARR
jgi:FAD/FMN-containing dehydrogenase